MDAEPSSVAEIRVLEETFGPVVKVTVPRGTGLAEAVKLQPVITEIINGLNGCPACTSGCPVWIVEEPEVRDIVKVDLKSMRRI
jgi:heterodisulfide reductase subunit C